MNEILCSNHESHALFDACWLVGVKRRISPCASSESSAVSINMVRLETKNVSCDNR